MEGVGFMGRKGSMIEKHMNSNYLDEKMTLLIYQPESYSPMDNYHLCIMQDGNDYYQLGRIATLSDRLHDNNEIMNTIFVGIHYKNKYDRREKYHPNGKENEAYIQFLSREVVSLLDDIYPPYNLAQTRTLLGDSLAGTLALMTAIRYPNTFGNVILQSPYVDSSVLQVTESAQSLDTLTIYHIIGEKETAVTMTNGETMDFLTPNRELHNILTNSNASYEYYELEGGEHTWKYWQKNMKHALTSMFN